ncbi:MAG TPA: heme exporter protein CcmD [Aliidongia sp.]|nr:heme exporter protein CcmD [Aliidongia sp.]
MDALSDFLAMGGYAAYIWPAYAAAFLILGFFTVNAVMRYRAAQRSLARLQADRT